MTQERKKIYINDSIYVTKVDGKLVMVRKKRERSFDLVTDLLREVFGKYLRGNMTDNPKKIDCGDTSPQKPTKGSPSIPFQDFSTTPLFNPNANMFGPSPIHPIMGPMGPQTGIYRFGNRQLALLPLNPQSGPAIPPQAYSQPPWTYPQSSSTGGFNYPPMGTDPRQFMMNPIQNSIPSTELTGQTTAVVTKHICAECGKLRSRKYQHDHPLKPGETPAPAFCKKCQKDITSTEESESSKKSTKKQQKKSKKVCKEKKNISEGDLGSSKDSLSSDEPSKVSKLKKKSRSRPSGKHIPLQEQNHCSHKILHAELHDEDCISSRAPPSPLRREAPPRRSRITSSLQEYVKHPAVLCPQPKYQARGSSQASISDEAEEFHDNRGAQPRPGNNLYYTDQVPEQSRSSVDAPAPLETISSKGLSFEDSTNRALTTKLEEASRRRGHERNEEVFQGNATSSPQGIRPLHADEVVIVTERFIYRPRHQHHVQEEGPRDHRQEFIDRTIVGDQRHYQQFVAKSEASEYYRNDWSRVDERDRITRQRIRPRDLEELGAPTDSHSSEATSSSLYGVISDTPSLSRASSPPRPLHSRGRSYSQVAHDAPHPPTGDEGIPSRHSEGLLSVRDQEGKARDGSRTSYRPPYVREATDKGTERALIMPSPKRSRDKLFCHEDTSETTEEIERVENHVTFRDPVGYGNGHVTGIEKSRST